MSFEGPVQQLFSLFEHLLNRLRAVRSQGSYTCPSFSAIPSPALPVLAAVCLRLRLLHPDLCSPLQQLAEGREMKEQKLANCEAVRRLSLKRWPHKDYLYVTTHSCLSVCVCVYVCVYACIRFCMCMVSHQFSLPLFHFSFSLSSLSSLLCSLFSLSPSQVGSSVSHGGGRFLPGGQQPTSPGHVSCVQGRQSDLFCLSRLPV